EVDAHYKAIELVGNISDTLTMLTEYVDFQSDRLDSEKEPSYYLKLKELIKSSFNDVTHVFPLKPLRIIQELRQNLKRDDILISDVGAHKIWIARFYPAYEPNTVIISNGFSSMGFALPAAVSAKMLYPEKNVVAVIGDGGFMMSVAELETAVRFNLSIVCLIFNDGGHGLISWKQRIKFGREFGCRFGNPDFARLAEAFGARGYKVTAEDELGIILKDALSQSVPSVIDCPVDYSENLKLSEALGRIICPT
ncbi:MAG: acetolactate synthase large subunit, partial [Nitrospirae bacterium]|nr:acetolactate synthase large subunit [Nitrospirota bacterium]